MVDPARLAWGLAEAAEGLGVRIAEGTRLESLQAYARAGSRRPRQGGAVRAKDVALATNVFPGPLRRNAWRVVPVYDYVLATEPLTDAQLAALGWDPGIGVADSGNQFHYYRLTPDRRILWGGYDAVYHFGRSIAAEHDDRPETFRILAAELRRDVPAARRHPVHAPLVGRDRHLHPLLRLLRHWRTAGGRRTPRGSPVSASAPRGSPPT